ncbi:MAG: helix-turn-helix transcriptional regulator [Gemmatimonas sp.]
MNTGTVTTTIEHPAKVLGAFLRRARERARPHASEQAVGFTRRRAPGLRREEAAMRAGISVTWYTWLEQGRDVRVSADTLRALGAALSLDDTELRYLEQLARVQRDGTSAPLPPITGVADSDLRLLVDAMTPHPAYAVNGLWDVLCANDAANQLFGPFDRTSAVTGNILRRLFLDTGWRSLFVNWEEVAQSAVAQFRAASALRANDLQVAALVHQLQRNSESFSEWWSNHLLAESPSWIKRLRRGGEVVEYNYVSLAPEAFADDIRVVTYLALPTANRALPSVHSP